MVCGSCSNPGFGEAACISVEAHTFLSGRENLILNPVPHTIIAVPRQMAVGEMSICQGVHGVGTSAETGERA